MAPAMVSKAAMLLCCMGFVLALGGGVKFNNNDPLILRYYIHEFEGIDTIDVVAPPNSTGFGNLRATNLPITAGPDYGGSMVLGAERCLVVAVANSPSYIVSMYVCTITYNDGMRNGIFTMHGEANAVAFDRGWEFSITGGSGDFRGAYGHAIGFRLPNYSDTHVVYYYTIHIYLPDPPISFLPDLMVSSRSSRT